MTVVAVLWDLDGVLVNSMEYHYQAFREIVEPRGRELSREEYLETIIGLRNDAIFKRLLPDISDDDAKALAAEKEAVFRRLMAGNVTALPGAERLLSRAREAGLRQAIVSSTPRANIDVILRDLGIAEMFDTIVGEEDASRGKPDPEGFIVAAQRLGVPPSECVVIEDAPEGIAAGKAAGMRCIGVTTTRPAERLAEADLVAATLEDERVWAFISGSLRTESTSG